MHPSPSQFADLARQGFNRVPVVLETYADLDTPLSVYLKLADAPYSYLFESVIGGERFGRYSIVGLPATTVLTARGDAVTVTEHGRTIEQTTAADPLAWIAAYQARTRAAPVDAALRFAGGLVGYLGYDVVRSIEPRLRDSTPPDSLGMPDLLLMRSEELAVVDNLSGKLFLIVYADPAAPDAYARAGERLHALRARLRGPAALPPVPARLVSCGGAPAVPFSEIGKERFLAAVARAQRYIVDGDIMQVQISQRIRLPFAAPPIHLYRALRSINPSPYMFYLNLGEAHVVGASPEILVRREGDTVTVRPIAGTRPRGRDRDADLALERELLADPKEQAEHLMLIDLGRNDIGRVAATGSVKVTERMVVERYSHVMHIVSNVEGRLRPDVDTVGLLRATFPAGTVTGTPKVRAMEIIDELEPSKRGVYAGAVGYLGFNGNTDMAITIRTAVVKDGMLYAQAAAGIVADSVPESEWQETENKARAVLRAAELALSGLDEAPPVAG